MRQKVGHRSASTDCGVEASLEVIGGKWKGVIVYHLLSGRKRFGELQRLMPNVTQRMLTRQLRELERDGLLQREIFAEVPPRVEYSLTSRGGTLEPVIRLLRQWGDEHVPGRRE
jgi:DNA-binding HxlR family transcriptional regulator